MPQPDQRTRFTERRLCTACGELVLHYQVANFDKVTGFKTYEWIPTRHRCTNPRRQAHDLEAR